MTDTRDHDLWNHPRIGDWQEEVHNGDTLRSFREWLGEAPPNVLDITRPCPREGCDGTMIPEDRRGAPRVSFDWDGSGHIATACSRGCGMQSSATFTWDGFEGHHAEDEGEQAADEAQLTPRMRALLSEHGFGASFLAALTDEEEALLPVCPHEGTGTASEDEWKSGFAAGMEARA